jgi:sulfur-carrier protein
MSPASKTEPDTAVETRTVTLRYFAWVREQVGRAQEEVALPDGILTIADLVAWLRQRDEGYAAAFKRPEVIRAALDQHHAPANAPIGTAREIAFFPPVTGG